MHGQPWKCPRCPCITKELYGLNKGQNRAVCTLARHDLAPLMILAAVTTLQPCATTVSEQLTWWHAEKHNPYSLSPHSRILLSPDSLQQTILPITESSWLTRGPGYGEGRIELSSEKQSWSKTMAKNIGLDKNTQGDHLQTQGNN